MDPVTIMAGLAVLKKTVEVCKGAVDTCKDVSELSGSLNELFHHHSESQRNIDAAKNKKKPSKLRAFLTQKTGSDEEDDLSIGAVAAEIIEKKKIDKAIFHLSVQIDSRFGQGTWKSIIDERTRRIKQRQAQAELAKANALKKAKADRVFWHKVLIESRNVVIIIALVAGMYFYISWACKGCI